MSLAALAISVVLAQAPAEPELAVIDARLGNCSAEFTIKDGDGKPIYAALIHVRVRYGFMSLKRMDLEVGTNSDGRARVTGLPAKAKPLTYDITKADKTTTAQQDLATACQAKYDVSLQ